VKESAVDVLAKGVDGPFFDLSDPPQLKLVGWRERELHRAGVPLMNARILAARRDVDLHRALDMLGAGCPHYLVSEILL
jgi:hypothetical protein